MGEIYKVKGVGGLVNEVKVFVSIAVVVLLAMAGGFYYLVIHQSSLNSSYSSEGSGDITSITNSSCSLDEDFCRYSGIPQSMNFTSPNVSIPASYFIPNLQENDYLVFVKGKMVCAKTQIEVSSVSYFYRVPSGKSDDAGNTFSREALVCGSQYFIYEYRDLGLKLYGPFNF